MNGFGEKMKSEYAIFFFLFFLTAFTVTAQAHLIGGNGFEDGLTHPLFGLDHLLAMVAVGIISTQFKGKWIFIVPAIFVSAMVLGGTLAIAGIGFPAVETGIGISVLVFGTIIAFYRKIPLKWALACIVLFGLVHGHAHGKELPLIADPVLYIAGFILSTAALHLCGVITGHFAKKTVLTTMALRASGALAGLAGLMFLAGF